MLKFIDYLLPSSFTLLLITIISKYALMRILQGQPHDPFPHKMLQNAYMPWMQG